MSVASLLIDTVITYRPSASVDSGGSPVDVLTENISNLSCRVEQETGLEPVVGGRQYQKNTYILYCAVGTDLLMKDIISYNSGIYEVTELTIYPRTYLKIKMELQ